MSDLISRLEQEIVQAVAELPDRTSPDDWPEAMLVTADELRAIVRDAASVLTRLQHEKDALVWIRRKLGLPEDAQMFTGQETIAGRLHVWEHQARGYVAYIEAYKCDDKQGEIARLTVRAEQAEAALPRLHQERETPQRTTTTNDSMRDGTGGGNTTSVATASTDRKG